jgi:mono/diheme cytochrome c family protein
MPFNAYTKLSREDVDSMGGYLNTIPTVSNPAVANQLPFPFSIRASMSVWDALYFKKGRFVPNPAKPIDLNRGAYLVNGPAHCGACHTPKSILGGDKLDRYLQGSELQGWFAPNITDDDAAGLGKWSVDDITAYLATGHNRMTAATDPMAEAVTLSISKMEVDDLHAIATYLKSLSGIPAPSHAVPFTDPAMTAGGAIYGDQCSACHGLNGTGTPFLFPSVAGSSIVRSEDAGSAIRIIMGGARSVGTASEPTAPGMPAYGRLLDDEQVAAVLTYMRNTWGSTAPTVSPSEVSKSRSSLAARSD